MTSARSVMVPAHAVLPRRWRRRGPLAPSMGAFAPPSAAASRRWDTRRRALTAEPFSSSVVCPKPSAALLRPRAATWGCPSRTFPVVIEERWCAPTKRPSGGRMFAKPSLEGRSRAGVTLARSLTCCPYGWPKGQPPVAVPTHSNAGHDHSQPVSMGMGRELQSAAAVSSLKHQLGA